jgi:predicted secreted hydrolase
MNRKTGIKILFLSAILIASLLFIAYKYLSPKTYKILGRDFFSGSASEKEVQNKSINPGDSQDPLSFCQKGSWANYPYEWWYFSGHLEDVGNPAHKFGLTLIFFKYVPRIVYIVSESGANENFSHSINFSGYDTFEAEKLDIKKGDFSWKNTSSSSYKIGFSQSGIQVQLELAAQKNFYIITNEEQEFYCQQPRLEAEGTLALNGRNYQVKGIGLIDHQGFKSAIWWKSWKWYAIHLDNGVDMVFFRELVDAPGQKLGNEDLAILDGSGKKEIVAAENYELKSSNTWTDTRTSISYPTEWSLAIPQRGINLKALSIMPDQVVDGADGLYLGSFQITGIFENKEVGGRAQLEYYP